MPKKVDFNEGMVVQVQNVLFRIKRVKKAKKEILLRLLTPAEVKKVEAHIKREKEKTK